MQSHNHQTDKYPAPPTPERLGLTPVTQPGMRRSGAALPRMKKFRFELLAAWIAANFPPCRVADIGGGKGLLSYLLDLQGFESTVIDPVLQPIPGKYRNPATGRQVKTLADASVAHITQPYSLDLGRDFDLIVALHAHGVNQRILDSVQAYGSSCVVLPCCVIAEPAAPPPGQDWFSWLADRGRQLGLAVEYFYLNFSGQNVGFYVRGARPSAQLAPSGQQPRTLAAPE
ncbi:MAG: hypothetical protein ACRDOK_11505 [Streptosporangiaceae bacterium]